MKKEPLAGNPFLMRRNKYQPPKTGVPKITSGSENSVVANHQTLVLKPPQKPSKNFGAGPKINNQKFHKMRFQHPPQPPNQKIPNWEVASWQLANLPNPEHPNTRGSAMQPPRRGRFWRSHRRPWRCDGCGGFGRRWKLGGAMPLKMHLKINPLP